MKQKSIKINALLNTFRQICTLIFPLITFPYISRVLQMENYGKISFVNSIISYFSLIAALGINNYAVREGAGLRENKKEFNDFANQIFTINIITTIISYILLFLVYVFWDKLHSYTSLIIVCSFNIIFATIGVEWIYTIYEDYLYITLRRIIIQIISLILMFLLVKNKEDYIIYSGITVFALGGANIFNFIHSRKYVKLKITKNPKFKKHILTMFILFCNAIMISIYVNCDVTIIGVFKSDSDVGTYEIAVKIYTIVKSVLNAAIIVVLPRLSFYLNSNEINEYKELSKKSLNILLIIILPSMVGLFMISHNVIEIIAGREYSLAETPLKILCISLMFSLIATFFVNAVLLPYKKEKMIFISTLVSSVLNLGLNFIFIPLWGIVGAAITTVLSEMVVMILSMYFSRKFYDFSGHLKNIINALIGCIGIIAVCVLIGNHFEFNIWIDTLLKILLSVITYFIILVICKNQIFIEQINKIKLKLKK